MNTKRGADSERTGATSFSTWTTLALLPSAMKLLLHGSFMGAVYLASLAVTFMYHWSAETRFRKLDHVLAYSVVAANAWMAFHAKESRNVLSGLILVLFALFWYRRARDNPSEYDEAHGLWHVLCGLAGWSFVSGYVG